MSGVDLSDKNNKIHPCKSCMKTVVQSFSNMQDQIQILNQEKKGLQIELRKSKKEKQNMKNKIKILEKKLINTNTSSFSKK